VAGLIARLRGVGYPLVTGPVAAAGGREIFVTIGQVSGLQGAPLRLSGARLDVPEVVVPDDERRGQAAERRTAIMVTPCDCSAGPDQRPADAGPASRPCAVTS